MTSSNLRIERCVECGKFMNCEEIDARCVFTPDSDYSIEKTEWTCGPCVRAERAALDGAPVESGTAAQRS